MKALKSLQPEKYQESPEANHLVKKGVIARSNSVSTRTVETWILQKKIPVVRFGRRCVRFHPGRVAEALRRFEIKEVQ